VINNWTNFRLSWVGKGLIAVFSLGAVYLIATAFANRTYTENELRSYVVNSENGLIKSVIQNGKRVDLIYQPANLLAIKNRVDNDPISVHEYEKTNAFILRIWENENLATSQRIITQPAEEFGLDYQYLSFGIRERIRLIQGGDTVACTAYHLERNYGITPYHSIEIAFANRLECEEGLKVQLLDNRLNIGEIQFEFDKKDIEQVTNLNVEL